MKILAKNKLHLDLKLTGFLIRHPEIQDKILNELGVDTNVPPKVLKPIHIESVKYVPYKLYVAKEYPTYVYDSYEAPKYEEYSYTPPKYEKQSYKASKYDSSHYGDSKEGGYSVPKYEKSR